ncbi:FtsQ-type POTRA domain-containing protein [Agrococcus beijingensis]|uniref:FtsQ-type POTRA domain-containing protein n=1 Tax=Agrococcus beijingensis TaxID=3068634 RepID=UPI002740A3E4|nr:FtsQ-type POTRA domain-containing protein [Agrococcus sp. REN33]
MRRPDGFERLDEPVGPAPRPVDPASRTVDAASRPVDAPQPVDPASQPAGEREARLADVLALDAIRRRREAASQRSQAAAEPEPGARRWALSAYELDEPGSDADAADASADRAAPEGPGPDHDAAEAALGSGGSHAQRVDRAWREAEQAQRRLEREEAKQVKRAARQARRARLRRERAEMRRFTAARRRQLRIAGATVGGLALVLALLVGLVWSPLMSVRDVRVEGAERLDPVVVQQALADAVGEPIATVTEEGVAARLQTIPQIESFRLDVVPPSTVIVRIVERVPAAIIPGPSGETVIDAAGVVLGAVDESAAALPRLDGVEVGSEAFEAVAAVLVAAPASVLEATVSIAAPTPSEIRLSLRSGQTVVWGGADESELKAAVVAALLETQDPAAARVLDVRAPQHPVVTGG